ncbi:Single-stranded DNA binding protein [Halobacterium sp. CBA1126]|uniref:Single-stranded DNA binding protein n=1 Tax=Halobacterium sp. CBA1126 TaxID=2668074 RepID=UPI0012FBC100|nr:Single-stranded DNA binding protein [Halobacterium sp. CBA1126]MUV60314.1 Single-stranded DNA binding protein [Halobacterium sp. CBA1126]
MNIDDHAEELASDLGVDKAEVEENLQNLVEYSVPVEEAKRSLRRKYGDDAGGDSGGPTAADIVDVGPDSGNVTVTAKVLTAGKRSIRYQGDDHVIGEGELADATGKISYTAWEDFGLEPGDTVTIGNASVREYEGEPELNFGESSTVSRAEDVDVPYDVGGDRDLADLSPGDRGRNVEVRVTEVEARTIDGRDGETEILSGVLGDESARLPFTDWNPHEELEEGASVRLEDVYVREFRGVPSVNVSEFSTVTALDDPVEVGGPTRMTIREAVDRGGAYDVELVGNVIEVRDGSGLIQRCPECGRVVQKGQCRQHGDVEGEDDLRVKAILDDGTDTVTVILDRELTEAVYGGDIEDARQQARDAMDQTVVADTIAEKLVGSEYTVRGHLSVDDYGANLETVEFRESADDPAERAQAFLQEVEA